MSTEDVQLDEETCDHFSHEPEHELGHLHICNSQKNPTRRCGYISAEDSKLCPFYMNKDTTVPEDKEEDEVAEGNRQDVRLIIKELSE